MVNEFMNLRRANGESEFGFSPSCDVAEIGNTYVLTFDLPGVQRDQIKVEANEDQITVRAERKEEQANGSRTKHLAEVYYGAYARTFTLPGPVDEKKVDAKFENGVLTVTIPKTQSARAKQIPIH